MTTHTAEQIVAQYIKYRDYVKARKKEFTETGATERDKEMIALVRNPGVDIGDVGQLLNELVDRLEQLTTPVAAYESAMETLEGLAGDLMRETGQKALSTEAGSAFWVKSVSVTCEDHEAFLNWVWEFNARQFLTRHVAKEAVEIYMDGPGQGTPPPGVRVTPVMGVQFRKS
jgi:hypothetical protein